MEVKFCKTNLDLYSEQIETELKSKGFHTEEHHCLGYCGDCMCGAIAVINDFFYEEETLNKLVQEL